MDDSRATSLAQIRALVVVNEVVRFVGQRREEVYNWVERTLVRHEYAGLARAGKGVLRLYLAQMTGLSRAQVTRLIAACQRTGRAVAAPYQRTRFSVIYTAADGLRNQGVLLDPLVRGILAFLDDHAALIEQVLEDLVRGRKNPNTGRDGITPSRTLRSLILMRVKNWDYRELRERINDGCALRTFTDFDSQRVFLAESSKGLVADYRCDRRSPRLDPPGQSLRYRQRLPEPQPQSANAGSFRMRVLLIK